MSTEQTAIEWLRRRIATWARYIDRKKDSEHATAILEALDRCWAMRDSHRLTPEAYEALRRAYGE